MAIFWQKLFKTMCFYHNGLTLAKATQNCVFWPKWLLERQSSQNRHAGLKFSSKRENSALSMKIVQNALFRSCAARFDQIAFLIVKVLKIVTRA